MKKKLFIICLLLSLFLIPINALASGGFNISTSSVTMYLGETKTIKHTKHEKVF